MRKRDENPAVLSPSAFLIPEKKAHEAAKPEYTGLSHLAQIEKARVKNRIKQTEIRSFHLFEVKILRIFPFYVPGHGSYPIYRRFCPLCNAKRLDVRQYASRGKERRFCI